MEKVFFHTFGCKLNHAETAHMAQLIGENNQYQPTTKLTRANAIVINTCSVTEEADKKCQRLVRRISGKYPTARIFVTGCYAQLKPNEVANIPGVHRVLGQQEKFELPNALQDKKKDPVWRSPPQSLKDFVGGSATSHNKTRAFLKVQDGCDYSCSFCTIPLARGKSRSDNIPHVLQRAKQLVAQGAKEIVLTGVNLGDFGKIAEKPQHASLLSLLQTLKTLPVRLRLSSVEPNLLSKELIDLVAETKGMMPHFHIPLQSGNDEILKKMRRRYLTHHYEKTLNYIKKTMPHACVGADVMVGFPGETSQDFDRSYDFLRSLNLNYLHVFPYSERNNTTASELPDPVCQKVRKVRAERLRILSQKKKRQFYAQQQGKYAQVLVEREKKDTFLYGYTENYVRVRLPYNPSFVEKILRVRLKNLLPDGIMEATAD